MLRRMVHQQKEQASQEQLLLDKSRSKKVGGTGLGLSIVKYALKCHGATIQVDSQVNQRTSMTVIFPREK